MALGTYCLKSGASIMLIAGGKLQQGELQGKVAIVTGAGKGIGYEAARALLWLGALVIIAEVDQARGKQAEEQLQREVGSKAVVFHQTDVASPASVRSLCQFAHKQFGKVDIVINNAALPIVGAVHELPMEQWDKSYDVNFKGPLLLTQCLLPAMLERDQGVLVFVSSSGAAPYLGGYEVFKTAQTELANTIAAELESSNIAVFTISPGLVATASAAQAIEQIAPLYGMTVQEFYALNSEHLLSVEAAGAGFAAAVALAEQYKGTEIGSIQALMDAGITVTQPNGQGSDSAPANSDNLVAALQAVTTIFREQAAGWQQRNIFERQWVLRDFKKRVGDTPEVFLQHLDAMELVIRATGFLGAASYQKLERLSVYYRHLLQLMKGYERNPTKVVEQTAIIEGWLRDIAYVLARAHPIV